MTNASLVNLYHHTTLTNGPREGTTRVDIGFHYAWASATGLADSDGDGLSDLAEDTDLDGVKDSGETDATNADSDQDGALDGEELAAGTDPNSKGSWIPKRLAAWWWEGANWRNSDGGQTPTQTGTEYQTNGILGSAAHFTTSSNSPLRYPLLSNNGQLNARLDHGSIRLWFKPNWVWSNHPASARLFDVGAQSDTNTGWWSWAFHNQPGDSGSNVWRLQLMQSFGTFTSYRYWLPLNSNDWTSQNWHQLAICYTTNPTNSANGSWLLHNGVAQSWTNSGGTKFFFGDGLNATYPPTATGLSNGFALGADATGTYPANGLVDSLETYNYPLGEPENYSHQQLTVQIVTNGGVRQLRWVRDFAGTPTNAPFNPWPLTLWRRPLGSTNWGAHLITNSIAESWTDTNVTVGTTYEYKAKFYQAAGLEHCRHFFAGLDMAPQHQRGNVILLVDSTLEPSLTNELAVLRTNMVGDGWTVKQAVAPRHDDALWTNNRLNLTNVVNLIASNTVSGTTNVVFLVGHVVIPYSGRAPADGHEDHRGGWPCDAYYGYLSKTGWTDTDTNMVGDFLAFAGDGVWDQDNLVGQTTANHISLGRSPDMAVGRLDFARLPMFTNAVWMPAAGKTNETQREVELIRMYLAKNWRYRTNGIPTFGRVSTHLGNGSAPFGANSAQSLGGAAFGLEPGRVFNGLNLLEPVPADLGVHFNYANGIPGQGVYDGRGSTPYLSTNFISQAQEIPVTFRHIWFSYGPDWAWMNSNYRLDQSNNWALATLGWTNHGLATVGGHTWDFAPLGGGTSLAALMTHGWEGQPWVDSFQSILGDPTLRLHRVTPPSKGQASRSGSTVTLTWNPSHDANCRYYVYRSTNGLAGFGTPLNSTPTVGLSFTDTTGATNLLYQIRAARHQVTGSGSFTNLSQGTLIQVP